MTEQRVTMGAGMTAGLEIWRTTDGALLLRDVSPDGRFADDVTTWTAGLRPPTTKKIKRTNEHQPKQDAAPARTPDTQPRRSRTVRK